ncbi:multiple epidermal growth factor-like domains protein 10 isoform X2 [Ostrea edulis]|uniref:multiple epidermal growth factor-like domains protein 10 isoform X2 n=1 Tax=Ostrea edulis TaxID=37623 RepID=UPI0024AFD405|nr:multiple epidermal growth factor-like domains protein 10 isoform X2 [Ostrea edulis]
MAILCWMNFILLTGLIHCYALQKPAWQEYNFPGKEVEWGAAKAVDGLYTNRSLEGNQCTTSGWRQTTATWRVDLRSVLRISHIDIYYRTDNLPSPGAHYNRFAGFSLYVSNTTSKDDGHLCSQEIQTVDDTTVPIENQTINCSVHGRYVIYYNERRLGVTYPSFYSRYAYNEICELEVYGCTDPTVYGVICDQPCPDGCQEKKCDVITGQCLGCKPGYQGLRCSQECDGGMYGAGCTHRCGPCLYNKQCHHVNGTCLNACSSGYQGGHCKENCTRGHFGINCENGCTVYCGRNGSCDRITGICDDGCVEGWNGPLCGTEELSSYPTIAIFMDDTRVIIVSLVGSVFIVLIGSVINFLIWKRNQAENVMRGENYKGGSRNAHNADKPSSANRVTSPYAEVGDLDKPNMYDELHL